jgi:hypothetical protein
VLRLAPDRCKSIVATASWSECVLAVNTNLVCSKVRIKPEDGSCRSGARRCREECEVQQLDVGKKL